MIAREGDLIKTKSGVVFDVKGLVHPQDRIIAFPRFIPSPEGTRQGKDALYGKVYSLNDRFRYLQENNPDFVVFDPVFGETMCEVPIMQIADHYQPIEKLAQLFKSRNLSLLENKALQLATILKKSADIPWNSIGISGSIMAGLTHEKSDIDPLVYGEKNSHKVYGALKKLLKDANSGFKPYDRKELQILFEFRSKDTQMSFEDFVLVENRKAFQGMFKGTEYFIRFVKDWHETNEQYGDICYKNSGYARICANVAISSDSLFTPCTYKLKNVIVIEGPKLMPIEEIVSFRGRFCEELPTNLREPPTVDAQGKVEHVTDNRTGKQHYRLIIGNKPSDYMVIKYTS
jgi:predicted nucleotidyltransferase